MYELTNLLTTIAGCSATVIAIVGGFIGSKLIALSTERDEILARLLEIDEEISFKMKKVVDANKDLDEDDALDFIRDNIKSVVLEESLDKVYKIEERPRLSKEELNPYWDKAIKISRKLCYDHLSKGEEVNDDGVPNKLAAKIEANFDYTVCKYAARSFNCMQRGNNSMFSAMLIADDLPRINGNWYHKTRDEVNKEKLSIEWLTIQKKQLMIRKNALKKPKGMKSGLVVFGLFSLFGVLSPLIIIPFSTENYYYYLIVKYCVIYMFAMGLLAVFMYLIDLLKWKEQEGH